MVEAAAGRVGVVKPQVSFFERYGSAGFAALEDGHGGRPQRPASSSSPTRSAATSARRWMPTARRGSHPGSPLEADAMTANPFLGVGTLDGHASHSPRRRARASSSSPPRATPRPSRRSARSARDGSDGLGERRSPRSRSATPTSRRDGEWASIGFVIGATVDWADAGLRPSVRPRRSSARDSVIRAPDPPISPVASARWRRASSRARAAASSKPARSGSARRSRRARANTVVPVADQPTATPMGLRPKPPVR